VDLREQAVSTHFAHLFIDGLGFDVSRQRVEFSEDRLRCVIHIRALKGSPIQGAVERESESDDNGGIVGQQARLVESGLGREECCGHIREGAHALGNAKMVHHRDSTPHLPHNRSGLADNHSTRHARNIDAAPTAKATMSGSTRMRRFVMALPLSIYSAAYEYA
jgi:hypothetical protein